MTSIKARFGRYYEQIGDFHTEVNSFMAKLGFDPDGNDGKVDVEIFVTQLPDEFKEAMRYEKEGFACLLAVATHLGLTLTYGSEEKDELIYWFIPFANIVGIKAAQ